MSLSRLEVIAVLLIHGLLGVAVFRVEHEAAQHDWQGPQYQARSGAIICWSPSNLMEVSRHPDLMGTYRCEVLPEGSRVTRVKDPLTETDTMWKWRLADPGDRPAHAWGLRNDFAPLAGPRTADQALSGVAMIEHALLG